MAVIDHYPFDQPPRPKQIKALEFIQRALERGYRDIVIEAPTGSGKSLLGASASFWAASDEAGELKGAPGGYVLVTQKLLQDQIENDFQHFQPERSVKSAILKSATEYECQQFDNCMVGGKMKNDNKSWQCAARQGGYCSYKLAMAKFLQAQMAVTNYAYFFTEKTFVGQMPPRRLLVADEAHGIERQVLGFVELSVNKQMLAEWAPYVKIVRLKDKFEFCAWLKEKYLPVIVNRYRLLENKLAEFPGDRRVQIEFQQLETHLGRIKKCVDSIETDPDNWIFWQEAVQGQITDTVAKPINAAPFVPDLLTNAASVRLYMSAYLGPKEVFCRTLGLDIEQVAWASLASTFPKKNRPVVMLLVGSMGRKSIEETRPKMLEFCQRILAKHKDERGVIHCSSYAIGNEIFNYLRRTEHGPRLLFARSAAEREKVFAQHAKMDATVLLSPSMTEGFDLKDGLARFQILAKCPYPYLGNPQVLEKKDRDPEWYILQTIMSILQAVGRGVRHDEDFCANYILDRDFLRLWNEHPAFFPRWFSESFVWGPDGESSPV